MTEPKWTKGPWELSHDVRNGCWDIDGSDGTQITTAITDSLISVNAPAMANAHLIAAAPDLYAALDAALETLQAREGTSDEADAIYDAARAALAKARGEA